VFGKGVNPKHWKILPRRVVALIFIRVSFVAKKSLRALRAVENPQRDFIQPSVDAQGLRWEFFVRISSRCRRQFQQRPPSPNPLPKERAFPFAIFLKNLRLDSRMVIRKIRSVRWLSPLLGERVRVRAG
jgi:hypothetical protein